MQSVNEFLNENYESIFNSGECTKDQVRFMIECLVEMSKSDEREFKSRIRLLFMHMLKYQTQCNKQSRSWVQTILLQSNELADFVDDRSLVNKILPTLDDQFQSAVDMAVAETGLYRSDFISVRPAAWTLENITNSVFIDDFLKSFAETEEVRKVLGL